MKKIFVLLISIISLLLITACSSADPIIMPSELPTATGGLQVSDPTEAGDDFSDLFGEESVTPTADPTGTPSATVQSTQKPTASAAPTAGAASTANATSTISGGLNTATEKPGDNWGPLM